MLDDNELQSCEVTPDNNERLQPQGKFEPSNVPKRQFVSVPRGTPQDLPPGGPMNSANTELTTVEVAPNIYEPQPPDDNNMKPAPNSNAHPEPQVLSRCAMNTLDLALDANNGQDDQNTSPLEPKKMRAAVALSVGQTETDVARLVGVNRTTIYRWQQDAEFVAEANKLKREYLAEQRARLHTLLHQAMMTLKSCLDRQDLDAIKVKAAMFIVSHFAPRAHETIGPVTEQGVKKVWKDAAACGSTRDEVHLHRVTEP
jgi:hypothetical protein